MELVYDIFHLGELQMYNNYQYFLVLAEEHSISRAAEKLFITHQSLSKYLTNLEQELGVLLFRRKPSHSHSSRSIAIGNLPESGTDGKKYSQ